MFAPLSLDQQRSNCWRCPDLLRMTEACPRQPDLLTFPSIITYDELYKPEQLAELKREQVPFHTFRENLLLRENMQPFVMNFILYSSYFFEVLMVFTSFLAALLPLILFLGMVIFRKPGFRRALIVCLTSKTIFLALNDMAYFQTTTQKFYVCTTADGELRENMGMSEQCFLASVFFTYLVLSTLLSMNNCICRNIIQRMNFSFYAMMVGAGFLFALYLSKMHLLQSSEAVIITSIELGMGFSILFLIIMIAANVWPIRLSTCFDQLPEEELLLNHLCLKWNIDT